MFLVLNGVIVYLYHSKILDFGSVISLNLMIGYYIPCIVSIMSAIPDYTNHVGILKSLNEFLSNLENPTASNKKISLKSGAIKINNLHFTYGNTGQLLFNNFNLEIEDGDHIAIIGESGNGKSTLIKLIMGYYPVNSGSIFIDGNDISKINLESLRKHIIFINQNTKLFNKSVYENIQYGSKITKHTIDKLYNQYNLRNVFDNLNDGFDTNVGVGGEKLSGGQKQLVQILRACGKTQDLKEDKKIFIFDEPTSSIDPETKKIIVQMIKELVKQSTCIIITHELDVVKSLISKSIVIENGKIIESNTDPS